MLGADDLLVHLDQILNTSDPSGSISLTATVVVHKCITTFGFIRLTNVAISLTATVVVHKCITTFGFIRLTNVAISATATVVVHKCITTFGFIRLTNVAISACVSLHLFVMQAVCKHFLIFLVKQFFFK